MSVAAVSPIVCEIPLGVWSVSNREYHADKTAVSHSALECFRESPRLYHGRYITGEIATRKQTPALLLGSLVHLLLLEPELEGELVAVAPECDRRTKDGKAIWAEFIERSAGAELVCSEEQYEQAKRMVAAAWLHPVIKDALTRPSAIREQAIRWYDDRSGITCKCKPDIRIPGVCLLDFKTSSDPRPAAFARAAANLGYHRQAAFYREGVAETTGEELPFLHAVIGTDETNDTAVYQFDARSIQAGEVENMAALQSLAVYRLADEEDWVPLFGRDINEISLPKWVFYEG